MLSEERELSELERLPVFEIDESQLTNMLDPAYGEFSHLDNVREKKLSSNTYIKIKNELKKIGIPGHIIDFVLEEIAGVEGDNVGEAVADLLPGSIIYGDKVADVINGLINNDSFVDVDLYTETIKSNNNIEGFATYYDIPVNGELKNNGLVVVTGLKYGKRDNFNVHIKTIDSNGNEKEFPVEKMGLNKREVAFVSEMTNIGSNVEKIRVEYDNDFDKPKEPSRLIADGIKDGINGATPIFNPISNGARNDMVKILNKLDMNELGGNGDVGVLIAENIVGQIPLIGTALKAIGGIDWLGNLIRKVVGQVEVRSYAAIRDGRILVKGYSSASQLGNFVDGATKESSDSAVKTIAYDYESLTPNFKYLGSGWLPGSTLYCTTKSHANTILNENDYGNVMVESVVNINEERGNAGIEFRVNNVKGTKNNFQGYLAGIGFNDKKQGRIFLGKQNFDWNVIKEANAPIVAGQDHVLKVIAIGKSIKVYLDGRLYINVTDDTYRDGYVGYQVWNTAVNFDNLIIAENVPFDLVEYNFASSKPDMDFDGEEWSYYEDTGSTKLRALVDSGDTATAVLEDKEYGNLVFDSQINKAVAKGYAGLGFRIQSNDNDLGYLAGIRNDSKGNAEVFLGKTSPKLEIMKTAKIKAGLNEDIKLTVVANGNVIQIFANGKPAISAVDNTYVKGFVGYEVSETDVMFDNFEVKESNLEVENVEIPDNTSNSGQTSQSKPSGEIELKYRHDFDEQVSMTVYDGSFVRHLAYEHSLYGKNTNSDDGLVLFGEDDFTNGIIETNITLYKSDDGSKTGNAGIVFRATDPKAGHNNVKAYYAGLRTDSGSDKDGVMFGILNNGKWTELAFYKANIKPVSNSSVTNNTLSVVAIGNKFDIYLNGKKVISEKDSTYSKGSVGLRTYKYPAIFQYIDVKAPASGDSASSSSSSDDGNTGIFIYNTNNLKVNNISFAISFIHDGKQYYTNRVFGNMNGVTVAELRIDGSGQKNSSGWIMGNYLKTKKGKGNVSALEIKNYVGDVSDVKIAMEFKMQGKKYVVYKSFDDLDTTNMFKLVVEGGQYFSQNDITRGDYLVPTY